MSDQRAELARKAMASQAQPRRGFGQVKFVDLKYVAFDKNERAFVETDLSNPDGQTEIGIGIETFKRDGGVFLAERKAIDSSFGTNNWRDITLESLRKLKADVLDLELRWVEFEFRQTKKWDKVTRSVVETGFDTFYFIRIFPNQESCESAWVASVGGLKTDEASENVDEPEKNGHGDTSAIDTAANTLYNLVGKDDDKFKTEVARNPIMMSRFGTVEEALKFVQAPF